MRKYIKYFLMLLVLPLILFGCTRKSEETYVLRNAQSKYRFSFENPDNTYDMVTSNLKLVDKAYSVKMTYKSENPHIILDDGTLLVDNLPEENIKVDFTVTFSITKENGKEKSLKKTHTVNVLGKDMRFTLKMDETNKLIYILSLEPTDENYNNLVENMVQYGGITDERVTKLQESFKYAKTIFETDKLLNIFISDPTRANLENFVSKKNLLDPTIYQQQIKLYDDMLSEIDNEKVDNKPITNYYETLVESVKSNTVGSYTYNTNNTKINKLPELYGIKNTLKNIVISTKDYIDINESFRDKKIKSFKDFAEAYDKFVLLRTRTPFVGTKEPADPANKMEAKFEATFKQLFKPTEGLENISLLLEALKNKESKTKEDIKQLFALNETREEYLVYFNSLFFIESLKNEILTKDNILLAQDLETVKNNCLAVTKVDLENEFASLQNKFLELEEIIKAIKLLNENESLLINNNTISLAEFEIALEKEYSYDQYYYLSPRFEKLYSDHLKVLNLLKTLKLLKDTTDSKSLNDMVGLNNELTMTNILKHKEAIQKSDEKLVRYHFGFSEVFFKNYFETILSNSEKLAERAQKDKTKYNITEASAYRRALSENPDYSIHHQMFEKDTYQIEKAIRMPSIRMKNISYFIIIVAMLLFLISQGVAYDYATKKGYDGIHNAAIATIPIFGLCYFISRKPKSNVTLRGLKKSFSPLEILKKSAIYLELILLMIIVLVPIVYIIGLSLSDIKTGIPNTIWPDKPNFNAYKFLINETKYGRWFGNSLMIALINMAAGTILITGAAYVFARYNFKGKKVGLMSLLVLQTFPSFMGLIAMYVLFSQFGLLGKPVALSILYIGGAIPGNIWLIKGFIDQIPRELDESAMLDGANKLQIFFRIILPLSIPILGFVAVSMFMGPWMDYMLPGYLLNIPKPNAGSGYDIKNQWTVAVGLFKLINDPGLLNYSAFAAGAIIVGLPITLLYVAFQKYLIEGIMSGATKG